MLYVFFGDARWLPDAVQWKGASYGKAMWHFWMQNEGVFGVALGVSATLIFLFVLFGAILEKAGAGNYFIKLAFALLGHFRGGPAKAVQMGRVMAADLLAAFETAEPLASDAVGASVEILDIPYFTRDESFRQELAAIRAKPEAERPGWEGVLLRASERWTMDGQIAQVPVQALRFGDVAFVALPGEVFVKWGLEIKHWSPASHTFVAELANGWFGYIPTTDQAHRGAYGAKPILSRRLIADSGRQITDTVQIIVIDKTLTTSDWPM